MPRSVGLQTRDKLRKNSVESTVDPKGVKGPLIFHLLDTYIM